MTKISSVVLTALLTLSLMGLAPGCGDDDNGAPVADADSPDPVEGECLERLEQQSPDLSEACSNCMCDNCENELDACDADPECQDKVECAQEALADGTCPEPADDGSNLTEVIECLETECDASVAGPEGGVLLCIDGNDCTELCL